MAEFKRFCKRCEKTFYCNGSCKDPERLKRCDWCYCSECYLETLAEYDKKYGDMERLRCSLIPASLREELALILLKNKLER